MSKASILASGYITYPNENLITKPLEENIYIKYVIVRDYLKNHGSYFYSEEIEYLFRLMNQNDNSINEMENRIRVIQLAKLLFNDRSILDWIELQKHNPLIVYSILTSLRILLVISLEVPDIVWILGPIYD